jgi:hypothetical protein
MDDDLIRMAAFTWLKGQVEIHGEILDWSDLANGFMFRDQRIHLVGQSGIWKPQVMQFPISSHSPKKGKEGEETARIIGDTKALRCADGSTNNRETCK